MEKVICRYCGSQNVRRKWWQPLNSDKDLELEYTDDVWCCNCEDYTDLIDFDESKTHHRCKVYKKDSEYKPFEVVIRCDGEKDEESYVCLESFEELRRNTNNAQLNGSEPTEGLDIIIEEILD